ncbi:hypothetical protein SAMN04487792_0156 [Lactobacillus bombicola]|uniref:Uncharacterized protein n=1 Tax=Lactobacillus bombicola TaxID=1505723 RepID=A0A1I1R573_9LACO|nr:hypothetical protein [Lactobacillus bombicola]MCO6528172.1 hypothetical protein [Lactobacillus sp.]SFD29445.1 hypothetical protein SAMN04487792_0156 [Lactobacillus bombicola]
MSIFKSLFSQQFKQKTKNLYLILLIEFIGSIAITFFSSRYSYNSSVLDTFMIKLLSIYSTIMIFSTFAFYIIICFINEKINLSQTWRLTPINDSLFYISNILSSFVTMVYFKLLELLTLAIFSGLYYVISPQVRTNVAITLNELNKYTNSHLSKLYNIFDETLIFITIMVLLALLTYLIISFLNFTSRAIMNFLPHVSGRGVSSIIRLVIIWLIAWLLVKISNLIRMNNIFSGFMVNDKSSLLIILVLLILNLFFLIVNVFLMQHYFEAIEKK